MNGTGLHQAKLSPTRLTFAEAKDYALRAGLAVAPQDHPLATMLIEDIGRLHAITTWLQGIEAGAVLANKAVKNKLVGYLLDARDDANFAAGADLDE